MTLAMRTGQGRAFQDGSLGRGGVFRDGVLGQASAFRDGSLGEAFRDGSLGITGRPVPTLSQRLQSMRARFNWRKGRGLFGLGEGDISVSASPTVKILGFAALVGLGAYGIYRVTQKK